MQVTGRRLRVPPDRNQTQHALPVFLIPDCLGSQATTTSTTITTGAFTGDAAMARRGGGAVRLTEKNNNSLNRKNTYNREGTHTHLPTDT